MSTPKRPGLSRAERNRMKALKLKQRHLLHDIAHKIDRRLALVRRYAPAEWLNRLTDEINARRHLLGLIELELGDLLDCEWAARREARNEDH